MAALKNGCLGCGGLLVVFAIIGYIVGANSSHSGSADQSPPISLSAALASRTAVATVDAITLWQQYDANEVAADNYYKGRVFRIVGTVESIDKDFMDNIVLHLRSPNEFMSTSATVDSSGAARAATLSKGDRVTLLCVVKGRVVGSPLLDDCTFTARPTRTKR